MNAPPDQPLNPAALAFLVEQTAPLEAGSVTVGHDGAIARREPRGPIRFGFRFAGRTFEAEARPDADALLVEFTTEIGTLPYSVENRVLRSRLLRVLAGLRGTGLEWELSPRQGVRVGGRTRLTTPAIATRIVTAVVTALLPVKAYFDLLDEVLTPPPADDAEATG
ncbi:hypothetical protein GCM10011611_46920 [Aliidongia dinghuensis]|uniref:Uncharacterized protein n=1 Tax=Aliidongia dinghuensis TaxID=1867774 RepID=A0A8J2YYA7_9PROT|nr:hypothetical protein [Aliidongia dinghuensis]GGF35244.1 hypothetical protein GCM10011611_46920 [Aliidongia dinghuensis]